MPNRLPFHTSRSRRGASPKHQQGQVLLLALFAAVVGWLMVLLVFFSGRLVQEKTKLTNTADSLAYSAAVLHARSLNFSAYMNRSMVANSVAIGQGVSLSSWLDQTESLAASGNDLTLFTNLSADFANALADSLALSEQLEQGSRLIDIAAQSESTIQNTLVRAQQLALDATPEARARLLTELAEASFGPQDAVKLDDSALVDDFADFLAYRESSGSSRLAEVVYEALNRDRFSTQRNWNLALPPPACPGYANTLSRTGGLQLVGNAQWDAQDRLVEYQWACAADCSVCTQTAKTWASADRSLVFAGFPAFADLSDARLAEADPRLRFSIRLRRPMALAQSASATPRVGRFAVFDEPPAAAEELVAVASSEVYFSASPNPTLGPGGAERANLFNPAWRARLASDPSAVAAARALQGIVGQ